VQILLNFDLDILIAVQNFTDLMELDRSICADLCIDHRVMRSSQLMTPHLIKQIERVEMDSLVVGANLMQFPKGTQTKKNLTRASTFRLYACHCSDALYCSCFMNDFSNDHNTFYSSRCGYGFRNASENVHGA